MNKFKRLHMAAIFVTFFQALKHYFFPLLFSFFLGGSEGSIGFFRFEYIWILLLIIIFISGIAEWATFKYKLEEEELYVERGVFIKKKRYIHPNRVHSIDLSQGIIQRLFGLVKVSIETAGGGSEPEVELLAIRRDDAELIREQLLKTFEKTEKERNRSVIWELSKERLILAALTSSGVGIVFSAIAALFSQIEQFLPDTIYEAVFQFFSESNVAFLVVLFVVVFLIAWGLAIIGTILKYAGFQIEKAGDEIIISRGLLERRQLTLQTNRVTAVRIVRSLFRQPFGFSTVYVESAGGGTTDEQLSTVLFPIIKESELKAALENILPDYAFSYELKRIPKRACLRSIVRITVLPLIVTIGVGLAWTPLGFYGLFVVVFAAILGYFQYRDAGVGWDDAHLWVRFRKVSQVTVLSSRKKIQAVEIRSSPLQRRKSLSTLRFSILSTLAGKTFSVRDLDQNEANKLLLSFRK